MSEFISSIARAGLGLGVFLGVCWLLSENRRRIDWRLVAGGMGLQAVLAVLILKVRFVEAAFDGVAQFFVNLLNFSRDGAIFLFGDLVQRTDTFGFVFAVQVLPTIVFFAAFSSILYYLGILQRIVFCFAWVMKKTMRMSGAESLATAANVFIGQTEAPLVIRPYLERMTRSEIMCLMTGGMATIAGGVLVSYIGMLGGEDEAARLVFARHLLTASILSAPAAIVAAKMLVPETNPVDESLAVPRDKVGSNLLDAAAVGTTDGVKLAVNVAGALLVFTALVALVNYVLGDWVGGLTGLNGVIASATDGKYDALSLQFVLGLLFSPVSWLVGVSWENAMAVGQLLGERLVLNEFFAYDTLSKMRAAGTITDERSIVIATYALCGFANLVSMGIQVGGIGALVPSQRPVLAALAARAVLGGTFACLMTASIAAFLV
ncbi:nucleoside transporter C-terminal domain-containing protein [Opitutales bacterium ASA1]|uniref:NupC/NupG family nucleoside CNT transporter n=1 Tax=Congregicoccus parvus TaxID=3081749 RepID=UPI002B2C4C68|nr:nucleoside transporter C-terminal domain-containing protein [Opitutales bacterium ASA1]